MKNLPLFLGLNVFTYNNLLGQCAWSHWDSLNAFFVTAWVLADIAMIIIILGIIAQER
jgi:hypothetical protein